MVARYHEPVLLHVVTEKGKGFKPAEDNPVVFHAPAPFVHENGANVRFKKRATAKPYTQIARDAILERMEQDKRVVAITAAMCQGNMLEPVREKFPERFFDVGICESHAVAFAAGMAKVGVRPIVDIYSTFLQRSYDQIFQEVALQNLPVTMMLDRAGLAGADGPTHHGAFDLAYLRHLPNLVVMAPGDAADLVAMVEFSLACDAPTAIRYPKAPAVSIEREPSPIRLGAAEVFHWGRDGVIVVCGGLLDACLSATERLRSEGLDVGVINARFVKPLDTETILRAIRECPMVVAVEEGTLMGGFSSAVLEAACDAGLNTAHLRRLGIPDRFIEHGERDELLAEIGLDECGIYRACREMADRVKSAGAR
jgi:1-deoxy-D-xylulose-5-phosphate synthase